MFFIDGVYIVYKFKKSCILAYANSGADSMGRGGAPAPPLLQMGGQGGTVSRTANKKLNWTSRKRSPTRLIVLLTSKSGGARPKQFPTFAPDRCHPLLNSSRRHCMRIMSTKNEPRCCLFQVVYWHGTTTVLLVWGRWLWYIKSNKMKFIKSEGPRWSLTLPQ